MRYKKKDIVYQIDVPAGMVCSEITIGHSNVNNPIAKVQLYNFVDSVWETRAELQNYMIALTLSGLCKYTDVDTGKMLIRFIGTSGQTVNIEWELLNEEQVYTRRGGYERRRNK